MRNHEVGSKPFKVLSPCQGEVRNGCGRLARRICAGTRRNRCNQQAARPGFQEGREAAGCLRRIRSLSGEHVRHASSPQSEVRLGGRACKSSVHGQSLWWLIKRRKLRQRRFGRGVMAGISESGVEDATLTMRVPDQTPPALAQPARFCTRPRYPGR